jgi:fructokinase
VGDEALRVIEQEWRCDPSWIRRLDDVPTGRVNVTLNERGDASYELLAPVAWDFIEIPAEVIADATCPLMVPSVGLRSPYNRDQIRRAFAGYEGMKCFDANLRPPHNSIEIVMEIAAMADFVKMNEEELGALAAEADSLSAGVEGRMRDLADALGVNLLCVTRAERPALLLGHGRISAGRSFPVEVKDTVGAGDAFMASMIASLSREAFDPVEALSQASALGSWVASKSGAQPSYDGSEPGGQTAQKGVN